MLLRIAVMSLAVVLPPAAASDYPIITSITTTILNEQSATYDFTQSVIDIGPAADIVPPMLKNGGMCLRHRHDGYPGGRDVLSACTAFPLVNQEPEGHMTLGELAMKSYNSGAAAETYEYHGGEGNGGECLGYVYGDTDQPWSTAIFPPGTCVYAPPGQDWCSLESPALVLDHGAISLTDASGHTATDRLQIQCSAGMTVRLSLVGHTDGRLGIGDEGASQLSTSGGALGEPISLVGGENSVDITSTLQGVPVGSWVASGVLMLEPL